MVASTDVVDRDLDADRDVERSRKYTLFAVMCVQSLI